MDDSSHLPLYFRRPGPTRQPRRETPISQPRSSPSHPHKCVHLIPLILLLSFSILWWFSYRVNLVVKDGRIVEIVPIEIQNKVLPALNDTDVELAILTSAMSPIAIEIRNKMLPALNDTGVELAILTSAMSPIASTPLNLTEKINETESLQMSKLD